MLGEYIRRNKKNIRILILWLSIYTLLLYLYGIGLEVLLYAAILCMFAGSVIFLLCFYRFIEKHRKLERMYLNDAVDLVDLPKATDRIEQDYQRIVTLLNQKKQQLESEDNHRFQEMMEYYSMWAHQIKTPIAAMRLILQTEETDCSDELKDELFKIEQYVEMVLGYLRMQDMQSDLRISKYSLENMLRQAVRKYAKVFIRKKIKIEIEDNSKQILTDEKWFVFVLEQLISNALKYTKKGCISIYLLKEEPNMLVISDTGIGIKEEDLPRIFEKGFTGFNGREDKKSTGIGLYLCDRILKRLGHTIRIESVMGEGTKVKIGIATYLMEREES